MTNVQTDLGHALWKQIHGALDERTQGRIVGLSGVRVENDGHGVFLWYDEVHYDNGTNLEMFEVPVDDMDAIWESFFSVVPSHDEHVTDALMAAVDEGDDHFTR